MLTVNLGNQTFVLPTSWREAISTGKYDDIVKILAFVPSGDSGKVRTVIYEKVLHLYGLKQMQKTDIPAQLVPSASMMILDDCYPALAFIFDDYCIDPPMPVIWHKGISYQAKGIRMLPMTGREMEDCSWAYAEWQKTGDIKMLDTIIGILYKPRRFWMRYWPFRARAKRNLTDLPSLTKLGIKFWYESTEAWWKFMYRSLYEGDSETPRSPDSLSMSRLIRQLSGLRRGTVDDVRKMNRDEIMFELAELDRERDEAEK